MQGEWIQKEVVPQFPLARLALPAIHDTSSSFWSRNWLPASPFTAVDAFSNRHEITTTASTNPNTSDLMATSSRMKNRSTNFPKLGLNRLAQMGLVKYIVVGFVEGDKNLIIRWRNLQGDCGFRCLLAGFIQQWLWWAVSLSVMSVGVALICCFVVGGSNLAGSECFREHQLAG